MKYAPLLLVFAASVADAQNRHTDVVKVVRSAGPAVVNISAVVVETNPFRRFSPFTPFWREQFRRKATRRSEPLGSGVIITDSGLVLTNEHVVGRASDITVTLADRRTFSADVVGADPAFDIAVLQLQDSEALPFARLGISSDLMPGEPAIAIGNPFGLSNTVTTGVISALHRSMQLEDRSYEDFIQTDAAINPGNSGGALLNIKGELIGINTAIHSSGEGIGFAIPIDKAALVVEEVLAYGKVRPVHLGFRVKRGSNPVTVESVESGGSAAAAGLLRGDAIVDVGGQQIETSRDLAQVVRSLVPGQEIVVTVRRERAKQSLRLVVRELSFERAVKIGKGRLGVVVQPTARGLKVKDVRQGGVMASIGVRPGDILVSLAGRSLEKLADFDEVCAAIHDARAVTIIVGRRGRRYYATLELR